MVLAASRPGDWNCTSCGNLNYASRTVCNKCGQPPGFAGAGGYAQAAFNPAAAMTGYGGCYGMAKGCGKGRPTPYVQPTKAATPAAAATGATKMRPGDWFCSACNNHNYASKTACNKCGVPKQMQSLQVMAPNMGNMGNMGFGAPPANNGGAMRPGDWTCHGCKNLNYASRTECNKCGISKATFISKSGMRPGDWICASCGNHNYASKQMCNKCAGPKTASTVSQKNMRQGDWLCQQCGNHNYADKVACNRCQAPKI